MAVVVGGSGGSGAIVVAVHFVAEAEGGMGRLVQ